MERGQPGIERADRPRLTKLEADVRLFERRGSASAAERRATTTHGFPTGDGLRCLATTSSFSARRL
jgi:hypothetical protein